MKEIKYKDKDVDGIRSQLEQLEFYMNKDPEAKRKIGNLIDLMMPHIKENLDNLDTKYADKSQSE